MKQTKAHNRKAGTRPRLSFSADIYSATIFQIAVALLMLWLSRFIFIAVNFDSTGITSAADVARLAWGGLRFDIVAVCYINSLFILLRILPFGFTCSKICIRITDWIYWITNSLMLAVNTGDIVYYRFSGSRLRWSGLREAAADTNFGGQLAGYAAQYWWAVILFAAMVALLVWLSLRVIPRRPAIKNRTGRIVLRVVMFLTLGGLTFLGIRGRVGSGNPLNIADATWSTTSPPQVNVVLNTPFTLMRSIGKDAGVERLTFFSRDELNRIRTSEHMPSDTAQFSRKNVMIIIIESGGAAFIDTLNTFGDPGKEVSGLMPFIDSLATKSTVVTHFLATGRRSNEGACAILGSFPAFEPLAFMLSPYNAMSFDSPATLLGRQGYESVFYYGCNHGSFNIDQLAHATGFRKVVDRAAYPEPDRDYDHAWGIFDGPMGQFIAKDLNSLRQPWISSWFTISAHGPYKLPVHTDLSGYRFHEPSAQRGLEYTDRSLRQFFETARRQPWFNNTIFIITGDHGNRDMEGSRFDTPYIRYHVPLIIFTPDGSLTPRRISDRAGTQFDIAPTLMSLLGYPEKYVAVGTDLLDSNKESYGISFIDNRFMISSPQTAVFTDAHCSAPLQVFDTSSDPELKHPLTPPYPAETDKMMRWAKAFLQDYTNRINSDSLRIRQ